MKGEERVNGLIVKKPGTVMWEAASLGEIMLRLDLGDGARFAVLIG